MHKCPKCGTDFYGNFCPECGEKYAEQKTCPKCGTTLSGDAKFCPECGHSFYESSAPAAKQPEMRGKPVTTGVQKLYGAVSGLPAVLFGLISVLLFLFFLAPVAVMPGGELFGENIPSESYGNVYAISNYDGMSLTGSLTMLIVFASCALFVAFLVCVISLFSKPRYKRVALIGKPIFLRSFLTGIGYVLFFALFLIACILLGQISNEDGGLGMFTAGAAPILTLVFTLLGCLTALVCAFVGKHLRSTYPALVAAQEKKIAAAKPTAVETWIKRHKKLTAVFSVVLIVAVVVGVAVPVGLANRHNGIYYAYNGETEEYNTERYYKLSGSTWQDEDGNEGKITFDGDTVTLTYGKGEGGLSSEVEGTLNGDVLKIGGQVFAKEGHEHMTDRGECVCGHFNLRVQLKEDGTYSIVGKGNFDEGDLVIPSEYLGSPVTSIGERAFYNCSGLTSVTISDSVTEIEEGAFRDCSGLESVTIGSGVTSIGDVAFYNCSGLTSIEIPDSVTEIGWGAFSGCSGLTSVNIGNGVTSIGSSAFSGCSGLEHITVAAGNQKYHSEGDCLIETDTNTLILGCKNSKIPDGVIKIGYGAFSGCKELTSIEIPDGVTEIGRYAFYECSGLTSVTIGNGVTSIGDWAFIGTAYYNDASKWDASGVLYIGNHLIRAKDTISGVYTVKPNTKTIASGAFEYCSGLKSIVIPDSVTSIGSSAFEYCSGLASIEIPAGVTSIGHRAFYNCSGLKSIVIPDGVIWIGNYAFEDCSGLKSVTIGRGVTSIGNYMFQNCSRLTSVVISDSVTSIEWEAFYGCSGLENISVDENNAVYRSESNCVIARETNTLILGCKNSKIPDSVARIGQEAFRGCSGLKSIEIPNSVTSIGERAFYGCSGLKDIQFKGTVKEWQAIGKVYHWNYGTGDYTVTCTDGTIAKDGTVTYFNN